MFPSADSVRSRSRRSRSWWQSSWPTAHPPRPRSCASRDVPRRSDR